MSQIAAMILMFQTVVIVSRRLIKHLSRQQRKTRRWSETIFITPPKGPAKTAGQVPDHFYITYIYINSEIFLC